jgi:hypothetical protein
VAALPGSESTVHPALPQSAIEVAEVRGDGGEQQALKLRPMLQSFCKMDAIIL